MALVFPTPAQAAVQTPVNTFSPSSTPITNTSNGNTYTYIPAKGVWVLGTSGGIVTSVGVVSPLTSSGGSNPIISIDPASTAASGAVQLNDTTNSPSTTQAATARAVCAAANLAGAAIPCACLLAKGDILGATAANTPTALSVGTDGQVLAACSAAATGLCWIPAGTGTVTSITAGTGLNGGTITTSGTIDLANTAVTAGSYTYSSISVDAQGRLTSASSGSAPNTTVTAPITNGGTAVAPVIGISAASDSACGAVELATSAETQTGTDTARAVTPAGAAATYIPLACLTAKGVILGASAANTPSALTVGTDGQVLYACSTAATGLCWAAAPSVANATPIAAGKILGFTNTTANSATALGFCALGATGSVGFDNVAVGYFALRCSTSGISNTAVGSRALRFNTTASNNTAVGYDALTENTTGVCNTAVGSEALDYNTTGSCNTAIGVCSMYITCGSCNVAMGVCSMQSACDGDANVAIGYGSMAASGATPQSGLYEYNTAIGAQAMRQIDCGCHNIAVGFSSLYSLLCGNKNIAIGCNAALNYNLAESNNTILGGYLGVTGESCTVTLATGDGTIRAKFNANGALSFDGSSFGTAGQVLQSNGTGSAPTWVAGGGGGSGTVTSITAGTGLTGGTITTSGTIALANTAVTCGSYTYASITVDCQGRLTCASSGTAPVTCVTGSGAISVTSGATPVVSVATATTTVVGAVELATNAETQTGTDTSRAVTPAGAKATYVPNSLVFKGSLITACVAGTPVGQSPGSDGQVLVSNSFTNTGLEWQNKYAAPNTPGFVLGCTDATNAALGCATLFTLTTGTGNVAIGLGAGGAITCGSNNVAIGCGVQVTCGALNCQLAIGFSCSDNWITGNSTKAIKLHAGLIDCANTCGTAGQVLFSTGANSFCWGNAPGSTAATPTVLGVVYGKQASAVCGLVSYGYGAGKGTLGDGNTVVGYCALTGNATTSNIAIGLYAQEFATSGNNIGIGQQTLQAASGNCNVAVGNFALSSVSDATVNTAIGTTSLCRLTRGGGNVGVGWLSLCTAGQGAGLTNVDANTSIGSASLSSLTCGSRNTAIGYYSASDITTGCNNVAIGHCAQVASPTGSCQLAIGYSATANWLTGNGSKAIQPGAGIIDCANSCGSNGQVLMSNGANAVCWADVIWQNITPTTTTSTAATTIITLPIASVRGVTVNISVSNTTTGRYHNDMFMIIHDGTTATTQLAAPGAHIGGAAPYTLSATVSGANLLVQVTSAAASSTKYVGIYQTFPV